MMSPLMVAKIIGLDSNGNDQFVVKKLGVFESDYILVWVQIDQGFLKNLDIFSPRKDSSNG